MSERATVRAACHGLVAWALERFVTMRNACIYWPKGYSQKIESGGSEFVPSHIECRPAYIECRFSVDQLSALTYSGGWVFVLPCPIFFVFFQCNFTLSQLSQLSCSYTQPNHNLFCQTMISFWFINLMLVLCLLLALFCLYTSDMNFVELKLLHDGTAFFVSFQLWW